MVGVAIIGAGKWGFNWVRTLAKLPQVDFRYCCDLSPERLEAVRQQFPKVNTTSNLDEVLADKNVHGVVIATTAPTHHGLASQCINAGKHVLVEKPLTLTISEANDLVRLATENGRTLMVGHLLEYHPAILHIKQMIDQGELGEVYYIYSQRLNLGTVRKHEDAWWSLAPHDISVACKLFDESPVSVQCRGTKIVQPNVADVVFGTLGFSSGRLAHIHVSWLDPHKTRRMTVVGSKKMVSFDDTLPNYQIMVHDKNVSVNDQFETFADWISMHQGDIVLPQIRSGEPLLQEAKHFVHCIETGETPVSDGISGLRVVSVLEKGSHSMESNGALMDLTGNPGPQTKVA